MNLRVKRDEKLKLVLKILQSKTERCAHESVKRKCPEEATYAICIFYNIFPN